jgi:glycosyltransferase involved in cell wall biosynthesis
VRVLGVGNMYPPHHLGGYELVWRSATRHLRDRGHVTRVLTGGFRTETVERDDDGTFRELRSYWRDHAWPRLGWRARIELERHNAAVLERHLEELRPDVVGWWAMGGLSLSLLERVRRAGLPAVAFVADDWLLYGPKVDRWLRPFRLGGRAAAGLAERVTGLPARVDPDGAARYVFASQALRERALEAGLRLAGSEVAHLGVDPCFEGAEPPPEWGWRLLSVGRIDERKGVLDAVAALAALAARGVDAATLTLAGDGDPAHVWALADRARELGVAARLTLLGMRSHAELRAIYAAADAVLFPVRWFEPWGLVPLEAMAVGRPLVATGQGGSREYLRDGDNCLLVEPGRPDALAGALERLAGDPGLRAALVRGGRETASRYTERAFNEAVEAALRSAAGAGVRDRGQGRTP